MQRLTDPRSGFYRENGSGRAAYPSFVPAPLQQIELNVDDEMRRLADRAMQHLRQRNREGKDRSESAAAASVHLAWNVPPLLPVDDILRQKIQTDTDNLRRALRHGLDELDRLPLSGRLIRDLHRIALQGEHNEKKYAGAFRTSPVWIGAPWDTLATAPFIPPSPEDMLTAFYDLERYINTTEADHPLIRAALIHYQFEVIHPFVNGNGRIGRLLVLLFLVGQGILDGCTIGLSTALQLRQPQYVNGLSAVELSAAYERWVRFFLTTLNMA